MGKLAKYFGQLSDKKRNEYSVTPYLVKNKSKFAVICPGGGYEMICNFNSGTPVAKELNKRGISAFVLRYHTKEKGRFPIPQDELRQAIKDILKNAEKYNVEKEGYSVWGFSAGGHLAASIGTDNVGYIKDNLPKPSAIIMSYSVVMMDGEFAHIGSRDNLLGQNPSQELVDAASITKHIGDCFPPTYIWTTKGDELVNPQNSFIMAEELKKHNIKNKFTYYDNDIKHGAALAKGTAAENWFSEAINFWLES